VTGEPDTFFTIPAATARKGLTIKGFLTTATTQATDGYTTWLFVSTDKRPNRQISGEYRQLVKLMKERTDPWTKRFPQQRRDALAFQGFPYDRPWYTWQD
jgi:hypothetical protein